MVRKVFFIAVSFLVVVVVFNSLCQAQVGGVNNVNPSLNAPVDQIPTMIIEVKKSQFHQVVLDAAKRQVNAKKMSMRDFRKLRRAMRIKQFREEAKETLAMQMYFGASVDELAMIPMSETGQVQVEKIDWEGLASFVERVLPLILSILAPFLGGI